MASRLSLFQPNQIYAITESGLSTNNKTAKSVRCCNRLAPWANDLCSLCLSWLAISTLQWRTIEGGELEMRDVTLDGFCSQVKYAEMLIRVRYLIRAEAIRGLMLARNFDRHYVLPRWILRRCRGQESAMTLPRN